jgi:hypothetical protein
MPVNVFIACIFGTLNIASENPCEEDPAINIMEE